MRWARCALPVLAVAAGCATSPVASEPGGTAEVMVEGADWALEDLSSIGYVQLTVAQHPSGPRLTVQRVARDVPAEPPPSAESLTPRWRGDVFVVAPFQRRSDNVLGGRFGAFHRAPSSATARLVEGSGLEVRYHRAETGWAGLWIHLFDDDADPRERRYLDAREASHLVFEVRGAPRGDRISVRIADRALELAEDSAPIGPWASFATETARGEWSRVRIPIAELPGSVDRSRLASLVFLVSGQGHGDFELRHLALVRSDATVTARPAARPLSSTSPEAPRRARRALWVWVAAEIVSSPERSARFFELLARWEITDVYLQVPRDGLSGTTVAALETLAPLVKALSRRGVRAEALDGHPRFVLPEHHRAVLDTVDAVAAYNRRSAPDARFRGVRFDNEPYLLPGFFSPRQPELLRSYVELLEAIRPRTRAASLGLGVDIPFWFDGRDRRHDPIAALDGRPFSEILIDLTDHVTLMDYRTMVDGPDGILRHAESELEYAARVGKSISLGLETVWLPDETILEFGAEGRGDRLAVLPEGDRARLVWFGPGSGEALGRFMLAHPNAQLLEMRRAAKASARKITFWGRGDADLEAVLSEAHRALRGHPAFAGFALHSYRGLLDLGR